MNDEIDLVKAVFAAFAERDVDTMLAHAADDIIFSAVTADYAGRTEPYVGHDGIREYFRDVASVWDDLRVTPTDFRQVGQTVLVTGKVSARSPARMIAGSSGWIWRVRDGKIVYGRVYPSAGDAISAIENGSSEEG
jgi:ketosteroid isomerase-like protein